MSPLGPSTSTQDFSSRKFLRFCLEDRVLEFRVLCFGLSTAPQVFTRVMATLAKWAHSHGIRLLRYLDDWLVFNQDHDNLIRDRNRLLQLCKELGIKINLEKSELSPARKRTYLGMFLDTTCARAYSSTERVTRLRRVAALFLERSALPASLWLSLLGHLASLEKLVPGGRSRMRHLQFQLKDHWSASSEDKNVLVPMSEECRTDLVWWCREENLLKGMSLQLTVPEVHLFTDASFNGWGAHLLESTAAGVWLPEAEQYSINLLELRAIQLGLLHFQKELVGKTVALSPDNTTALA